MKMKINYHAETVSSGGGGGDGKGRETVFRLVGSFREETSFA